MPKDKPTKADLEAQVLAQKEELDALKAAKGDKPEEANQGPKVKMYWVHPLAANEGSGPRMIFGRTAKQLEDGAFEVEVLKVQVKNERRRANPMLTEKEYLAHIDREAEMKELEEEDE